MRKLSLIVAAVLAVIAAAPAAAETWRSVGFAGQKPERFFYFIDVDSIVRDGHLVTFWEQESLEGLEPSGANRVFNYRRGNCRTFATLILRSRYLLDARTLATNEEPGEWVEHPAGSMMGDGIRMICGQMAYDSGPLPDPDAHARRYFRNN